MRPRKAIPSRRCSPCGNDPDPRAAKTQVACCPKCRAKLRNQQARARRAANAEKYHALSPDAVFVEGEEGDLEPWRLPQPKREEIEKRVERIAWRTLAMLKQEVGEDLRLDALFSTASWH